MHSEGRLPARAAAQEGALADEPRIPPWWQNENVRTTAGLLSSPPKPPPPQHPQSTGKTYYFTKDINFLTHEPLIDKFRAMKMHLRRVNKLRQKKQAGMLERARDQRPEFKIDHIVRER